jgi:hypothetical protein
MSATLRGLFAGVFFIVFDLIFRCAAGAENADGIFYSFDKTNKDNSSERRCANDDFPVFFLRVLVIIENEGKGIFEDRHGFFLDIPMLGSSVNPFGPVTSFRVLRNDLRRASQYLRTPGTFGW